MNARATDTTTRLGLRVREAREARRVRQQALAELTGIGQQKLSRIEHGTARADLDELEALAAALQVPAAVLAGWAGSDGRVVPPGSSNTSAVAVPKGRRLPRRPAPVAAATPGSAPVRVNGRLVVSPAVHVLFCGCTPDRAVPGAPELRGCPGCGCATEAQLSAGSPGEP